METILYTRIKGLCLKHGISLSKLESNVGLSTTSIRKWKNQSSPSVDKILLIARYFNVSSDYLLGLSNIPSTVDELIGDEDLISIQRARSRMSAKDTERMMKILKIAFENAFMDDANQPE